MPAWRVMFCNRTLKISGDFEGSSGSLTSALSKKLNWRSWAMWRVGEWELGTKDGVSKMKGGVMLQSATCKEVDV